MRIFDAHLHADTRSEEDFRTMALFGVEGMVTCAHDFFSFSSAESIFDHFQRLLSVEPRRVERHGIKLFIALGIHPNGIPKEGWEKVIAELPRFLKEERVVAIGEIGLQKGSQREVKVFTSQLELGKALNLPVVIHTPEKYKKEIIPPLLALIEEVGIKKDLILIDHTNESNLELVKESESFIGLSVHPEKLDEKRAAELVGFYGAERIILSSDLASAPSDLYSLPKVSLWMKKLGLKLEEREAVIFSNALKFYQIKESWL